MQVLLTMNQMSGVSGDKEPIKISKEEVAQMPLVSFDKEIIVIDNLEGVSQAVAYLKSHPVIGFDTETKPAFKKGQKHKVALIQLATADYCFLFRLNIIGFPEELADLLCDKSTLKIGLSIKDDYMTMRRMAKFDPSGFIELQSFVKNYNIGEASLQKIYAILFGEKISKSQRLSNWEAETLSEGQKRYAAIDAWACLVIYNFLASKTKF